MIMKNFRRFSILFLAVLFLGISACKKSTDDGPERKTDPEFQTLVSYLSAHQMDLSHILSDWIIPASAVNGDLGSFYVIDIRAGDDYNAGHIEGAVNSSLAGILDAAKNAGGKTIVVACYTGQTAAHAVVALRLSGYSNAKVLKWGMAGWTSSLSTPWESNVDTKNSPNWIAAPGGIVDNKEFDDPDLQVSATDGKGILAERVNYLLTRGFKGISSADVLASPGDYFINNFWDAENVKDYGNIANAHRIKPLTLANEDYKYIDPSQTVVTYCWTGQTSSMVTAYLAVLGYNTKSLKFGVNSIIYDDLKEHKWSTPTTDLPLVTEN